MAIPLYAYTVFRNPPDHPDKWVIRRHRDAARVGDHKDEAIAIESSYLVALRKLPAGLARHAATAKDHPSAYEVWR